MASSLLASSLSVTSDSNEIEVATHLIGNIPPWIDSSVRWNLFCIICSRFHSETIIGALNALISTTDTDRREDSVTESKILSLVLSSSHLWIQGSSRDAATLFLQWIATEGTSFAWLLRKVRGLNERDRIKLRTAFETITGTVPTAFAL